MMNFNKKMLVKETTAYINALVKMMDEYKSSQSDFTFYYNAYITACAMKSYLLNCISIHHMCDTPQTINSVKVAMLPLSNKVYFNNTLKDLRGDVQCLHVWEDAQKAHAEGYLLFLEKLETEREV